VIHTAPFVSLRLSPASEDFRPNGEFAPESGTLAGPRGAGVDRIAPARFFGSAAIATIWLLLFLLLAVSHFAPAVWRTEARVVVHN
jgi:hypothetical protein